MKNVTKCYFCGHEVPEGVYRLNLFNKVICAFCERRIINTSTSDNIYEFFRQKIKRLWVS